MKTSLHDRNRQAIEALRTLAQTGRYELPAWLHSKIHRTATCWPEDEPWQEYWRAICTPQIARLITSRVVDGLQRSKRLRSVTWQTRECDASNTTTAHHLPLHIRHLSHARSSRLKAAGVCAQLISCEMSEGELGLIISGWERWLCALCARVIAHPGWPVMREQHPRLGADAAPYVRWAEGAAFRRYCSRTVWDHAYDWTSKAASDLSADLSCLTISEDRDLRSGFVAATLHELLRRLVAFDLDLPADQRHNAWIRHTAVEQLAAREEQMREQVAAPKRETFQQVSRLMAAGQIIIPHGALL